AGQRVIITSMRGHHRAARSLVALAAILLLAPTAAAHPVPKDAHDRTVVVRLQRPIPPAHAAGMVGSMGQGPFATIAPLVHEYARPARKILIRIEYRLEVDEETVLRIDMQPFHDEVNFLDYFPKRPMEYYAEFARIYAPIYADL